MLNLDDTIVAVSTPAGAGERAIVRMSGRRAIEIAERVFVAGAARIADLPPYAAIAGRVALTHEHMHISCTLFLMRRPRSYTREDVVELHIGAWPAVVPLVVAALVAAGARAAEPGEFTLRALLAGRLDLAQAEAVMAVISAGSRAALRAAGEMLAGHLSREVGRMIDRLREVLALVEADLDFSDQHIEITTPAEIAARLAAVRRDLADLGRRSRGMEMASGDVRLVIAGRPNAGKSSLFNRLLAADRAIVSPDAGTTRDELCSTLHAGGLAFTLSDVAGIDYASSSPLRKQRETSDQQPIPPHPRPLSHGGERGERSPPPPSPLPQGETGEDADDIADKALARAVEVIGRADLVIVAVEANASEYDDIDDLLGLVAAPTVVAITKCDLAPPDRARSAIEARGIAADAVVATSAATCRGIDDLLGALVRAVEGGAVDRQAVGPVVTARHRAAMERAAAALTRAARVARRPGGAGDLVAMELREALDELGSITGRRAAADVLDEIFSRFCVGK